MFKIEPHAYPAARPVLAHLSLSHVAVSSLLDGLISGEIWMDSPQEPNVAVAIVGDAYFLAGDPGISPQTREALTELLPDWIYLQTEPRWIPHLATIWRNKFALEHPRIRLAPCPGRRLPERSVPPPEYEIVPINRALFESQTANLQDLKDAMEEWSSPEDFFNSAVGFCAVSEKGAASYSLTDCVSGHRCEVGVRTHPDFRRQGLGLAVASATVQECVRRGLTDIEWHTHASNKGSLAIGTAIGLVEQQDYSAFACRLPAENAGDLEPDTCRTLALHFERASAHMLWCRFPAAGAWVLSGDHEKAIENIRLLFQSDWQGDSRWLENFWALRPLQNDPAFRALLTSRQNPPSA